MLMLLSLALLGGSAVADDAGNDPPSLVAAIEALQSPIKDFRCEFEGRWVFMDEAARATNRTLGPGGLAETFGGSFVWQRDGDRRRDLYVMETMHDPRAREDFTQVTREIVIVHLRDRKIDLSRVPNIRGALELIDDQPFELQRENSSSRIGELFRFDEIKELVGDDGREATVTDDQLDGRPVKLLSVYLTFKNVPDREIPNRLMRRYWIDMARSGQVVRVDGFLQDSLAERCDITLKSFRVGGAEAWMPVAGEIKSYSAGGSEAAKAPLADRARVALETSRFQAEPTMLRSIRVIESTLEFNKAPSPATFTLKHKPAAAKSAEVRDLIQRFDKKVSPGRPSKAKAEKLLEERIAEADQQGRELIADPHAGIDWWTWSVAGLVVVLSASVVVLWNQRRPQREANGRRSNP